MRLSFPKTLRARAGALHRRLQHAIGRSRAVLRRGARDQGGMAGVEFSLLAPLMILMMFAAVEVFDMVRAARLASNAANVVTDLTSRSHTMKNATVKSMFTTGEALMGEHGSNSTLKITISSIAKRLDERGDETIDVIWSHSSSGGGLSGVAGIDLPAIPLGDSVILTQVSFTYSWLYGFAASAPISFERHSVRRPRFSNEVVFLED